MAELSEDDAKLAARLVLEMRITAQNLEVQQILGQITREEAKSQLKHAFQRFLDDYAKLIIKLLIGRAIAKAIAKVQAR